MEPNELTPAEGVPAQATDASDEDGGSKAYNATGAVPRRPRLKTPLEIQSATEPVIVLTTLGIMKDGVARTVLQGLKLQLDCTRAGESEGASSISGADIQSLANVIQANPEILQKLAPHMEPEALRDLLRGLEQ